MAEKDPRTAAQLTRKAIDHGLGITAVYSQFAKQQTAAGDTIGAEATFREALSIYPRSVFIRSEFAVFLENQGKTAEAAEQISIARSIVPRQANGWHMMISQGSVAAFYRAQTDKDIAPPAELKPTNAVKQYLDRFRSATEAADTR